ncbi:class I SAM-dependent methyltransferase [Alkalilacustris brevis]|uniref:class I SAM-dependent methyltransferase n=1 Tax=Alkalilacustris brevis TaxID=2026338 RepID=UPI00138FE27F|nr:class I SAM-dependent methyltransferase [Alkalilacustris brevis]
MPLARALGLVDTRFGIARVLGDEGRDLVTEYYRQAAFGFRQVHSRDGCMHMALNPDGQFDRAGYLGQADSVAAEIAATGAGRVLELGCGVGFNSLHLARAMPDVEFVGLDLLKRHVTEARQAARGMGNITFRQGSFEALAPEAGAQFDLVFAVECLCHARDLDALAHSVAGVLRPGGRLIVYDGYRTAPLEALPDDIATATRLTEVAMVVADGFRPLPAWDTALAGAGLKRLATGDLTPQVRPTTQRLQRLATKFFMEGLTPALARAFLPQYLLRNAVAGLLMPYLIAPEGGSLNYLRLVVGKPGAST